MKMYFVPIGKEYDVDPKPIDMMFICGGCGLLHRTKGVHVNGPGNMPLAILSETKPQAALTE